MGATLRYVKEFEFPSSGKVNVKGYARGGPVKKTKDDSANCPMHMAGMSMKAKGGAAVASGAPLIAMKHGGKAMCDGGMVKVKK